LITSTSDHQQKRTIQVVNHLCSIINRGDIEKEKGEETTCE
ncbi:hypothetical protein CCACVL1_19149, partial [Corchorus capsularis]